MGQRKGARMVREKGENDGESRPNRGEKKESERKRVRECICVESINDDVELCDGSVGLCANVCRWGDGKRHPGAHSSFTFGFLFCLRLFIFVTTFFHAARIVCKRREGGSVLRPLAQIFPN